MGKKAWFITHDDYVDRRIFFFVDVLERSGYQVKLFPAYYINVLSSMDPSYVLRPVSKSTVREYNVDFSDISEIEKLIIDRVQGDSSYIMQKERYPKGMIKFLNSIRMKNKVKIAVQKEQYCITILSEDYTLCYNSLSDSICRIGKSERMLELRKCEQAIMDVIMEKKQGIVDFDEGISVMQNVDEDGAKRIYASMPAAGVMYVYEIGRAHV